MCERMLENRSRRGPCERRRLECDVGGDEKERREQRVPCGRGGATGTRPRRGKTFLARGHVEERRRCAPKGSGDGGAWRCTHDGRAQRKRRALRGAKEGGPGLGGLLERPSVCSPQAKRARSPISNSRPGRASRAGDAPERRGAAHGSSRLGGASCVRSPSARARALSTMQRASSESASSVALARSRASSIA